MLESLQQSIVNIQLLPVLLFRFGGTLLFNSSPLRVPSASVHWCWFADRAPATIYDAKSAISSQIHQSFDVHRYFGAQYAFNLIFTIDHLADVTDFLI